MSVGATGNARGRRGATAEVSWGRFVAGTVIFLTGLVWFLQGVRVIPGSVMTGSRLWTVIGAVLLIAGAAVLATARRTPAR
jgi:hypothetical protein